MSIQERTKNFLSSAMTQFGGETIVHDGNSVSAVIDQVDIGSMLGTGAKVTERTLIAQYSIADYGATVRSGDVVTARAEAWQVSSEPGAIRRGQAAVTLTLVEPERRNDF